MLNEKSKIETPNMEITHEKISINSMEKDIQMKKGFFEMKSLPENLMGNVLTKEVLKSF